MVLSPLETFEGAGTLLAKMVAKGRCTIQDLDKPPAGMIPEAEYRNLLRDWIAVNPQKWNEILDEYNVSPEPAVEAGPSPRDFLTDELPF
jgi:hypothetical protein